MTIAIRLKKKYTTGYGGPRNKATSGNSGKSTHHKLSDAQKRLLPPQPKMVMLLKDGKCRMIREEDLPA